MLTNGTLFYDKQVRDELKSADIVLPSLDAATENVFKKINRPPVALALKQYLDGLIEFTKEFSGKIWLEVLILPGYNDSAQELQELRKIIQKIKPDTVQINTLDRPGTEENLRGATKAELRRVVDVLNLDHVEIIAAAPQRKNIQSYRSDAEAAILDTIARRPCTLEDLEQVLGMHISEINKYLDVLDSEGKIEAIQLSRGFFYKKR